MASPTAPRQQPADASRGRAPQRKRTGNPAPPEGSQGSRKKKKCEQSTRTKTPSPSGPAGVEGGARELTDVCPAALLPGLPPRLSHGPPQAEPEPPRSLFPARTAWAASWPPEQRGRPAQGSCVLGRAKGNSTQPSFYISGVPSLDRKSTRLNSSHTLASRMPSSA